MTKLTEPQRAYMFEHWPKVCEIPWNQVDTKGPLAKMLKDMKAKAREATKPAKPAKQPAARTTTAKKKSIAFNPYATKTIAKKPVAKPAVAKKPAYESPYTRFVNATLVHHPNLSMGELMRRWKDMDEDDRRPYTKRVVRRPAKLAYMEASKQVPEDSDSSDHDNPEEAREPCSICDRDSRYCGCNRSEHDDDEEEEDDEDDEDDDDDTRGVPLNTKFNSPRYAWRPDEDSDEMKEMYGL